MHPAPIALISHAHTRTRTAKRKHKKRNANKEKATVTTDRARHRLKPWNDCIISITIHRLKPSVKTVIASGMIGGSGNGKHGLHYSYYDNKNSRTRETARPRPPPGLQNRHTYRKIKNSCSCPTLNVLRFFVHSHFAVFVPSSLSSPFPFFFRLAFPSFLSILKTQYRTLPFRA